MIHSSQDTIAAISTPGGRGAIGIVRLSGKYSVKIASQIFLSHVKKDISGVPSHTVHFGYIVNKDNIFIDEALLTVFREPHSYTQEDMIEISCHNNKHILEQIMERVIDLGARTALPGEFTQRAFLNGKIDLSQAEAVEAVIEADSRLAEELACKNLMGSVKILVDKWNKIIINILSKIEVAIDHDGIADIDINNLKESINALSQEMLNSCVHGERISILQDGIKIVIAGQPNVGKSSLLNQLIKQERAIVTDVPGTTRDPIEVEVMIRGVKAVFIDTAGLRKIEKNTARGHEEIERLGIEKTKKHVQDAHYVVYIIDLTNKPEEYDFEMITETGKAKQVIIAGNKCDLPCIVTDEDIKRLKNIQGVKSFYRVSALSGENIHSIIDEFTKNINSELGDNREGVMVNLRQRELVKKSRRHLDAAYRAVASSENCEVIALELQDAQKRLNEISGIDISEEVLSKIFQNFCVGK
ncbi:MAG: tRNA uridine-5-carboxymethylaminomethyl(34) synthesis GTPase MnmE [Elusimicrobiota bacterium]